MKPETVITEEGLELRIEAANLNSIRLKEIQVLFDLQFGESYVTQPDLLNFLRDPNTIILQAFNGKELTGVSILKTLSLDGLVDEILSEKEFVRDRYEGLEKIGLRKMTAVFPKWQNQNVATELTNSGNLLLEESCELIISFVWKKALSSPLENLLEGESYIPVKEIEAYWKADSESKGYSCAICGSPCECNAILYERRGNL